MGRGSDQPTSSYVPSIRDYYVSDICIYIYVYIHGSFPKIRGPFRGPHSKEGSTYFGKLPYIYIYIHR